MMQPAAYLDKLNPQQRQAVEHGVKGPGAIDAGPLLVIAGAGSGKTNTLAHRVAHLIVNGADPRRILLLTFSRRAAAEMTRRVARIASHVLGPNASVLTEGLSWAGTFHGIGARLLRDYAPQIGLDASFTIHDREDSADLMNLVRHELGFSRTEKRFPAKGTLVSIYSRAVNAEQKLEEVIGRFFPWVAGWNDELKALFAAYVAAKQAQGVLDYDDLLLYWAQMMAEPSLAADISARFDHVLIDEYQDTNKLQASILLGLKPDGRGLTVVGDDAQSIYSFRAASIRNILDFPGHFSPRADTIMLEQNYRSTQPILAAANAVIDFASERYAKNLWSERASTERPLLVNVRDEIEQANYVATRVLEHREEGIALKSQAVLFRAAHHSGPLEVELTRRNIPFVKFGGLKFLDSAHVKDVLGVLRFAENPRDRVAGFRVLKLLNGLGPATAGRVLDTVGSSEALLPALEAFAPPRAAAQDWPGFLELMRDLKSKPTGGPAGWPGELDRVRQWYEPVLERLHEDAQSRQSDLVQLAQIAATYPSRARFLTELTLDPPDATSDHAGPPHLDEDYLILSTIHSAKGQEWKKVFVLNAVDGCIPIDLGVGTRDEIEEERRLLYVAMTRARDSLHLMLPQRFFTHGQAARGDRHVYAARTRFIPPRILGHFAATAWPPAEAAAPAPRPAETARIDIGARMRAMWSQ
ncbi:DNA helicase-2/ATP-dependent DNA helicase PcrA [Angulomicrobium tetraedrale]|uniref:DNA 3'-5' helicase n=2 Tax=Ancylobacter tetraedralis TaxID=217068 RepID=A0A839ZB30_9HYPH|nr:DNA helicase-2/ATP-dependent DNA helicase PcrA [Ancylobacter tetraedralis]